MEETEKLTTKDCVDLAVQAGMGLIPYVGSTLQTLYYGRKDELRFKRIEAFYKELGQSLQDVSERLKTTLNTDNEPELISIIEGIHDEIETARAQTKRTYYRNLYKNSLLFNNRIDQSYYLELLKLLSDIEMRLLLDIAQYKQPFTNLTFKDIQDEIIKGSLNRLVDYGVITSKNTTFNFNTFAGQSSGGFEKEYEINDFGRSFVAFITE
ncbi:hypothetical protein HB815_01590 [Listeria booriae]|uniref:hypothetical protein n=1 Tax=Listeria booriae TaxID=1552123 RepID=UPI0016279E1F|nr:hypothetical protein [Listeria booriae]MBC1209608.1 hypothetical protein [Listeria booriae]